MREALITATERDGIIRINITIKEGLQIRGISMPLSEINPMFLQDIQENADVVYITDDAKDVLEKYLLEVT